MAQMRENARSVITPLAVALSLVCPAAATAASPGAVPWRAEPARYGVSAAVQHMVTMSDGVQLAADVYRPTLSSGKPASGAFPVIMSITPYGKRSVVTWTRWARGSAATATTRT